MKLPVDDVLPPVKFDFLLLDLRSLSRPCWFEICFDLSGSLLILSFVISFFFFWFIFCSFFHLFFVWRQTFASKTNSAFPLYLPLCSFAFPNLQFFYPNLPPRPAPPPSPLLHYAFCCRIISSTWVSWGCSEQLVSSSCWGREKPSASCSGPLFSPSRFGPIYTEQCAQQSFAWTHKRGTHMLAKAIKLIRRRISFASFLRLYINAADVSFLRRCLMCASSSPCCSSSMPSSACRWGFKLRSCIVLQGCVKTLWQDKFDDRGGVVWRRERWQ